MLKFVDYDVDVRRILLVDYCTIDDSLAVDGVVAFTLELH